MYKVRPVAGPRIMIRLSDRPATRLKTPFTSGCLVLDTCSMTQSILTTRTPVRGTGHTNLGSQVCKEDSEQGFLISFAIYYYCVDLPGASVSTGSTLLLIVELPLNEGTHKKS